MTIMVSGFDDPYELHLLIACSLLALSAFSLLCRRMMRRVFRG